MSKISVQGVCNYCHSRKSSWYHNVTHPTVRKYAMAHIYQPSKRFFVVVLVGSWGVREYELPRPPRLGVDVLILAAITSVLFALMYTIETVVR